MMNSGTVDSIRKVRYGRSFFYNVALKEYPNIIFRIDYAFQWFLSERLETATINSGTPVNIHIKSADYTNKITKHQTQSWYVKALQYREVNTLSNPNSHSVYLSLDEYKTGKLTNQHIVSPKRHATGVAVFKNRIVIVCGNLYNDCWSIQKI